MNIDWDFVIALWCAACCGPLFGFTGALAVQAFKVLLEAVRNKVKFPRVIVLASAFLSLSLISLGAFATLLAIAVFKQWPVGANYVVLLSGLGLWNALLALGLIRGTGRVMLKDMQAGTLP